MFGMTAVKRVERQHTLAPSLYSGGDFLSVEARGQIAKANIRVLLLNCL
jgi:hypothetical protein